MDKTALFLVMLGAVLWVVSYAPAPKSRKQQELEELAMWQDGFADDDEAA